MNLNIPEDIKVVNLLAPAADAGGRTGAYVSLKNAVKAFIVVHLTQGAANTVKLEPKQASAVAGTGVKVLTDVVPIWANLDTAASDALARVATDAKDYTTEAGTTLKQIVFEIVPAKCMDLALGFDCITVVTGASAAANITSAQIILVNRHSQALPPSAVVD